METLRRHVNHKNVNVDWTEVASATDTMQLWLMGLAVYTMGLKDLFRINRLCKTDVVFFLL